MSSSAAGIILVSLTLLGSGEGSAALEGSFRSGEAEEARGSLDSAALAVARGP